MPETLEHPSVPKGLQESRKRTASSDRTRSNGFNIKESRFILDIKQKFFTVRIKGDWRLEQVAQNRCGCPIPNVQGQTEGGFQQLVW